MARYESPFWNTWSLDKIKAELVSLQLAEQEKQRELDRVKSTRDALRARRQSLQRGLVIRSGLRSLLFGWNGQG